jgi:hypothetical protein
MTAKPKIQQTASVLRPNRTRAEYQVCCYRNDVMVMRLHTSSEYIAQELASHWRGGATQGELAQIMSDMGVEV